MAQISFHWALDAHADSGTVEVTFIAQKDEPCGRVEGLPLSTGSQCEKRSFNCKYVVGQQNT